jgi:hypothetical protein
MRRVLFVAALLVPALSAAQKPATVALPPADAKLETGFTAITSIRELSDGRILVTDPRDLGLVIADFKTGDVKPVSRRGQGPGEYGMAAPVYAIAGDSSLMPDLMSRRVLLFDADKAVGTVAADHAIIKATQGFIRYADRLGNVFSLKSADLPSGATTTTEKDSSAVIRVNRTTGRVDTIARVRDRPTFRTIVRNEKGEVTQSTSRAIRLTVGEPWIVHPDGFLTVVRTNPFRVDSRSPDGRWTRGAALPIPVIRMSEREKQASLARTAASQRGSGPAPQLPKDLQKALQTPDDEWPDVMPPYIDGPLFLSPTGDVLIRRQPSADHPGIAFYAVDRAGKLLGILELKANETIGGFGAKSIYIVESDADDLKFIRRHPWPFTRLPG